MAVEYANRSMDVLERENRIREEIKEGSTLSKVTELLRWEKRADPPGHTKVAKWHELRTNQQNELLPLGCAKCQIGHFALHSR